MDFKSTTRSIRDMLSLKRRFVIPRFQREYSWTNDELNELWEDLLGSLTINKENKIVPQEYFLGSIVLVGDEDSSDIERQVVDGQQRLMTITILFSVLAQKFKEIGQSGLSNKVHEYIIGEDENGDPITKLNTETPKPFFQFRIQRKELDFTQQPATDEERKILDTYEFYDALLKERRLRKEIKNEFSQIKDFKYKVDQIPYVELLKLIRDQILSCKVIYVTVKSFEDAYQIFEVLNAKGKDLEPTDIIKNSLFSVLNTVEPADFAYEKWKIIRRNISEGKGDDMKTFYRHFWLSKYGFATANRLVTEFNKKIEKNDKEYTAFLTEMVKASERYKIISVPKEEDFKEIEKKPILYALRNINSFGITQSRTIIMALLEASDKQTISNTKLIKTLCFLEYFHFVFNAVCSNRASALERKNSSYARKLNDCKDREEGHRCLNDYVSALKQLMPSYEIFENAFLKLYFTQEQDDDKKLIQYILDKYEGYCRKGDELKISSMTIEHILSESTNKQEVGYVGNLLPLGESINSNLGNAEICQKMESYKKSSFSSVKKFLKDYEGIREWTKDDIIRRTKYWRQPSKQASKDVMPGHVKT